MVVLSEDKQCRINTKDTHNAWTIVHSTAICYLQDPCITLVLLFCIFVLPTQYSRACLFMNRHHCLTLIKVLEMGPLGFSKGDLYMTFPRSFQLKRALFKNVTFSLGKVLKRLPLIHLS